MHPLYRSEANGGHSYCGVVLMFEEVRIFSSYWWERRNVVEIDIGLNRPVDSGHLVKFYFTVYFNS